MSYSSLWRCSLLRHFPSRRAQLGSWCCRTSCSTRRRRFISRGPPARRHLGLALRTLMAHRGGEESWHEAMESGRYGGSKKVFFLALARLCLDAAGLLPVILLHFARGPRTIASLLDLHHRRSLGSCRRCHAGAIVTRGLPTPEVISVGLLALNKSSGHTVSVTWGSETMACSSSAICESATSLIHFWSSKGGEESHRRVILLPYSKHRSRLLKSQFPSGINGDRRNNGKKENRRTRPRPRSHAPTVPLRTPTAPTAYFPALPGSDKLWPPKPRTSTSPRQTFPSASARTSTTAPRRCPSRLQKSKAIPPQPSHRPPGHHDDPIQRRRPRPRRRGVLVPAAPPALRVRRRVRLLPRLLLLPLPAAHLPGAPRPGRRARRRARGEAPQAAVRPQPGVRAVPPRGLAHVPRGGVPGRRAPRGPRRRLPLPQHHAALHRREPQQGGHPVRRHGVRRHVPRGAARGGGGARVRAARAQHPPAPDPRHCRPLQRAPDRRAGSHPRCRDQRPRRAPHHRRRRRKDPRARLLLAKSAGVGGLRDRHQPEESVAKIQAVRRGRAKRVGTKPPPPPPPPPL